MSRKENIFFGLLWFFFILGCGSGETGENRDRFDKGLIYISADESFKPVIDAQVQVYEAKYPDVKLNVLYKPEADCLRDLAVDSVRMIVATRFISPQERLFLVDSMKVSPEQMLLAYDAIAVIVHPDEEEYLFTMDEIREILTGKFRKNLIPVFDGLKATSTVRFIVDSVLRGTVLTHKALAAKNSEEVIDYVSKNPGTVGFIGVSWIGNKDDEQQLSFLKKVKLAGLESRDQPGKFVLPVQANIYYGRYPMIRELITVLKENYKEGLGHGFKNFMTGEKGQLIFRRAYLVPGQMQFNVRPAQIREN